MAYLFRAMRHTKAFLLPVAQWRRQSCRRLGQCFLLPALSGRNMGCVWAFRRNRRLSFLGDRQLFGVTRWAGASLSGAAPASPKSDAGYVWSDAGCWMTILSRFIIVLRASLVVAQSTTSIFHGKSDSAKSSASAAVIEAGRGSGEITAKSRSE
jgi:hypothetical protein